MDQSEMTWLAGTVGYTPLALDMIEFGLDLYADHPFIFLIWEKSSGSILFLGRVVRPAGLD